MRLYFNNGWQDHHRHIIALEQSNCGEHTVTWI